VRRAYKFRLRPTARQHVALGRCLASHRELYNAALQERRDAWRLSGTSVSYGDQSAQLKQIRKARPDVAVWSFSCQQATLRRLNRAFAGFFRRVNSGETPGYPRFRSAHRFCSVEWPKDGDGCRWHPGTGKVYLQGIGQVKVTVRRQVQGRVKTIQVRRDGRHWMLILSCDQVPTRPLNPIQAAAGVDVGIASFATTSDGQHLPNWGYGRAATAKLAAATRSWPTNSGARTMVAKRERPLACDLSSSGMLGRPSTEVGRCGGGLGPSGGPCGPGRLLAGLPGGLLDRRVAGGRPAAAALGPPGGAPCGFRRGRRGAQPYQKSRKPAADPHR
jgi:putative transposase